MELYSGKWPFPYSLREAFKLLMLAFLLFGFHFVFIGNGLLHIQPKRPLEKVTVEIFDQSENIRSDTYPDHNCKNNDIFFLSDSLYANFELKWCSKIIYYKGVL